MFNWMQENGTQITWFLIGFLGCAGLTNLVQGQYLSAAFNFALVALNYILRPKTK
jgi:hypothetical protein